MKVEKLNIAHIFESISKMALNNVWFYNQYRSIYADHLTPFHYVEFYENLNHYNTTISQSEENKHEEGGKHAPG